MTKDQERKVAALAVDPVAAKKRKFKFFRVYSILIDLHLILWRRWGLRKSQRFLFTCGGVLAAK